MTADIMLAIAVTIGPIALLFGYFGWLDWQENKPGSASKYEKRRIQELRGLLGQETNRELSAMSRAEAIREVHWLEDSLKRRRRTEEITNKIREKADAAAHEATAKRIHPRPCP